LLKLLSSSTKQQIACKLVVFSQQQPSINHRLELSVIEADSKHDAATLPLLSTQLYETSVAFTFIDKLIEKI